MLIKKAFTLIEVLIVVSILAILGTLSLFSFNQQRARAKDIKAKSDLNNLKIAFENYYNDHSCYPPNSWFDSVDDCNSTKLSPYLNFIPCDQNTGLPYPLETDDTTCKWFKLYATFSLPSRDEQAVAQQSLTGSTKGNYGVSSSNVNVSVYYLPPVASILPSPTSTPSSPVPTPSPSPSATPTIAPSSTPLPPTHDYYWCSNLGNCTSFDPQIETCTPTYVDNPNCDNLATKCAHVGTCTRL